MLETLRDPFWQFVVVAVLTLATLIVSVIGLRIYRNRKRLAYKVILQERLLGVREDMEGRVQITFDGKPVHDVRMVVLHLLNTGNVPIEESDYVHPIGFNFGSDAKVLSAEVVKAKPDNMTTTLETTSTSVALRPDVLNGGDGLELKVLLTGDAEVKPEGRVRGVHKIKEMKAKLDNP